MVRLLYWVGLRRAAMDFIDATRANWDDADAALIAYDKETQ